MLRKNLMKTNFPKEKSRNSIKLFLNSTISIKLFPGKKIMNYMIKKKNDELYGYRQIVHYYSL